MSKVTALLDLLYNVSPDISLDSIYIVSIDTVVCYHRDKNYEAVYRGLEIINHNTDDLDNLERQIVNDLVGILKVEIKKEERSFVVEQANIKIDEYLGLIQEQFNANDVYPDFFQLYSRSIQDNRFEFNKIIEKMKKRAYKNQCFIVFALEQALALNLQIYPKK